MSPLSNIKSISIRNVEDIDEMRTLEALQMKVWGDGERDVVPISQFVAAQYVGGTLIGAFDDEKLVGFAYGFYGHLAGVIIHHSHMVGIDPDYRGRDLGFRLKAAQRERVLADKITDRMTWTFDPLQSLNAHFNFGKLGVISDTYKINVYGEQTTSFLHQNGTDRLFVTWILNSPRVEQLMNEKPEKPEIEKHPAESPILILRNSNGDRPEVIASLEEVGEGIAFKMQIPADINNIERTDIEAAREWRSATRMLFLEAISRGFVVVDYSVENERSGAYLLKRSPGGIL